jgi:hypothetical protein
MTGSLVALDLETTGFSPARGDRVIEIGMEGVAERSLRQYRQFYSTYPRIWQTLPAEFIRNGRFQTDMRISGTLIFSGPKWKSEISNLSLKKLYTAIVGTLPPQL